jgi:hypothetical protein
MFCFTSQTLWKPPSLQQRPQPRHLMAAAGDEGSALWKREILTGPRTGLGELGSVRYPQGLPTHSQAFPTPCHPSPRLGSVGTTEQEAQKQ